MFLVQHFVLYSGSRYPEVIRLDELGQEPGLVNDNYNNDIKINANQLNIKVGKPHIHTS